MLVSLSNHFDQYRHFLLAAHVIGPSTSPLGIIYTKMYKSDLNSLLVHMARDVQRRRWKSAKPLAFAARTLVRMYEKIHNLGWVHDDPKPENIAVSVRFLIPSLLRIEKKVFTETCILDSSHNFILVHH